LTKKQIIIIGDRVLIEPDDKSSQKTKAGLYLPQGVASKESVQSGCVVMAGPGIPMPSIQDSDEPWDESGHELKYMPMQVEIGDQAIFLSRLSHKIEYEGKSYFIVPQSGILMIIREENEF
jgi:chaperonin GroES